MIAITFALPAESSELLDKIGSKHIQRNGGVIIASLQGQEIAIFHTGVGRKHCRRAFTTFLEATRPQILISSGFAGSLTTSLNIGDLFVARNYSDPRLLAIMEGGVPAAPRDARVPLEAGSPELTPPFDRQRLHSGVLLTIDSIAHSAEERQLLAKAHRADAIDMETDVIAETCRADGIPMLSLRAISDSPADPFPAPPDVLFDVSRQKTNFARLIPHLLAHPGSIIALIKFAQRIGGVRSILANALVETVRLLPHA